MKIIGFMLIMIFSCGIGRYITEKEKRKVLLCGEICHLLEHLSNSVSSGRKIDDIISCYCDSLDDGVIKANNKKELMEFLAGLNFDERFEKLLYDIRAFLEDFGRLQDSEKESKRCTEMLCGVKTVYERYKADFEKKEELYKKLGFICGIIVCIVFI